MFKSVDCIENYILYQKKNEPCLKRLKNALDNFQSLAFFMFYLSTLCYMTSNMRSVNLEDGRNEGRCVLYFSSWIVLMQKHICEEFY